MTPRKFQSNAERIFLKGNPTAVITSWVRKPQWVTYPTGLKGIWGTFHAVADGYKPRVLIADWDAASSLLMVR